MGSTRLREAVPVYVRVSKGLRTNRILAPTTAAAVHSSHSIIGSTNAEGKDLYPEELAASGGRLSAGIPSSAPGTLLL